MNRGSQDKVCKRIRRSVIKGHKTTESAFKQIPYFVIYSLCTDSHAVRIGRLESGSWDTLDSELGCLLSFVGDVSLSGLSHAS
jgi:hypothetical protein